MTPEEIYKNNKLIANFLNCFLKDKVDLNGTKIWEGGKDSFSPLVGRLDFAYNLKFHSDYGWIMPVLNKIINIKDFPEKGCFTQMFLTKFCSITARDKNSEKLFTYMSSSLDWNISMFEACVKYIEWYNKINDDNKVRKTTTTKVS